jgi:hypothetical protein
MIMYEWTLATIREKVRAITGYLSTGQMANADMLIAINQFYQNELPRLLGHSQFHSWFTFNTVDGTGSYTIDDLASDDGANIISFDGSYITIDDIDATVYYDRSTFFGLWPESDTWEEDVPTDMLIEGRTIWLRPPPDAVYVVKMPVVRKCPVALADDSDKPLDPSWGPMIAYGAAIGILAEKSRDFTKAAGMRDYYLAIARSDEAHRLKDQSAARSF